MVSLHPSPIPLILVAPHYTADAAMAAKMEFANAMAFSTISR
jgi:hypothetical protein